MDEIIFGNIIKITSIVACVLCFITGLDLVSGARILLSIKGVLDRKFNADKLIIKIGHFFRNFFDAMVNFDDTIIVKPRTRVKWGFALLALGLLMAVGIYYGL
jgi:hypothetical protein